MAAAVASAALLVPSASWACGGCVEHQLRIHAPYLQPVSTMVVLWYSAHAVLHPMTDLPTPPWLRWVTVVLTFLVCAAVAFISMGAPTVPMLAAGACLLLYAAAKTAVIAWKTGFSLPLAIHAAVHVVFLAVLAVLMVSANERANEPEGLVSLLSYSIPETSGIAVPRVLALGPSAVKPLSDAAERGLERNSEAVRYAAFCLERICDAPAEAELARLGRELPATVERARAWEPLVYAWAGCAKGRAVAPLRERLEQQPEGAVAQVLVQALLRTGTKEGLDVALAHHAVLVAAVTHDPVSEKAALVLRTLATATSARELAELPLYRAERHALETGRPSVGFEREFYASEAGTTPFAKDVPAAWKDAASLKARWSALE